MDLISYECTNIITGKEIYLLHYGQKKYRVVTGKGWYRYCESLTGVKAEPSLNNFNCSEVIVRANIKPFKTSEGWIAYKDQDDPGNLFFMQNASTIKVMNLLLENKLENKMGWISGVWSFRTLGGHCTIEPARVNNNLNKKPNQLVSNDALDVSEFL